MVSKHENQVGCSWNLIASGSDNLAFYLPWVWLHQLVELFFSIQECQKKKITDIDLTICANETIFCNLDTSAKSRVKLCLEGWSRNLQVGAGLLLLLFVFFFFLERARESESYVMLVLSNIQWYVVYYSNIASICDMLFIILDNFSDFFFYN